MDAPINVWAWCDQARVIKREVVGIAEGEPQVRDVYGAWFACRLPPKSAKKAFDRGHRSTEDTREFSAMLTPASAALTEGDMLEVTLQNGDVSVWHVDRVDVPRNGGGFRLLVHAELRRREEK